MADALEPVSVALKFGFLIVLYLFLLWIARSALRDLRRGVTATEHPPDATGMHPAVAGLAPDSLEETEPRKNVVVVSTGQLDWSRPDTWTGAIDRSPCGTGTCALMAALHAKGELGLDEPFVHEGILGTVFEGRLVEQTRVGPYDAVVPTLSGQAWITGFATYVVDETDPFPNGFTVGDIWGG